MNKRQIEKMAMTAQAATPNEVDVGHVQDAKIQLQKPADTSDDALLAMFFAARLATVNTMTRMDGTAQMNQAMREARQALRIFREDARRGE